MADINSTVPADAQASQCNAPTSAAAPDPQTLADQVCIAERMLTVAVGCFERDTAELREEVGVDDVLEVLQAARDRVTTVLLSLWNSGAGPADEVDHAVAILRTTQALLMEPGVLADDPHLNSPYLRALEAARRLVARARTVLDDQEQEVANG